jgi:hypothetical protein
METLTNWNLKDNIATKWTGKAGDALGKGLLAGAVGTAAITASQMIEMKIDGRKPSTAPEQAAEKVFDVNPKDEAAKEKINHQMHWAYGISWGIPRAILSMMGVKGPLATAIHFGAVWGAAMVMLPSMKLSKPVTEWKPKEIAIDALHHAVYATAAGLLIDAIFDEK